MTVEFTTCSAGYIDFIIKKNNKQCWFSWHFGKDRCYLKPYSLLGSIVTIHLCSATLCVFSAFHLHFEVKKLMQGLKGKLFFLISNLYFRVD